MTEKDIEKLEQYLFIIQIIAERADDENSDAIILMAREAMKLLAQRIAEKSEKTEGEKKW